KAFIANLSSDHVSRGILNAIAQLGQALDLNVVAEGVETQEQERYLADVDCAEMQGFLFSQPIGLDDIAPFLLKLKAGQLAGISQSEDKDQVSAAS
ncbi:MAG: EAL domain-containing protein, partial [Pseudomonadota bacterium]